METRVRRIKQIDHPPPRLRYLRLRFKDHGWWLTIEEVARFMGVSVATARSHESGRIPLDDKSIMKYSKLYKVHNYEIYVPRLPEPQEEDDVIDEES